MIRWIEPPALPVTRGSGRILTARIQFPPAGFTRGDDEHVTIREIAEKAGVSIGTVDRVLHNRGRFSEGTAARVRKVIAEVGFRPNPIASQLSRSAVLRVSVLLPHPHQDSSYWEIPLSGMRRAERELSRYNATVTVHHYDRYLPGDFERASEELLQAEYDACIVTPLSPEPAMRFVEHLPQEIPVVLVDTELPSPTRAAFIGQDSRQSGRLAAKLMRMLTGGGQALVVGPVAENPHLDDRIAGFTEAYGETARILRVSIELDLERSRLFERLDEEISEDVTGVFVVDASVHFAAEYVAQRFGSARRPGLIGFDLVPENRKMLAEGKVDFILTQRPVEQGYRAVMRLFRAVVLSEPIPRREFTPIDIVTQENDEYFVEWENV